MPAKFKVGDYAAIKKACPNSFSEATYHKSSSHMYTKAYKVIGTGPSFNDNIYKGTTYELEGASGWYYLPYHLEKVAVPVDVRRLKTAINTTTRKALNFAGGWSSKPSLKKQLVLL